MAGQCVIRQGGVLSRTRTALMTDRPRFMGDGKPRGFGFDQLKQTARVGNCTFIYFIT